MKALLTKLISSFLLLQLISCSSESSSERSVDGTPSAEDANAKPYPSDRTPSSSSSNQEDNIKEIPLSRNSPGGTHFKFIPPQGLHDIYKRVFLKRTSGQYGGGCEFTHIDTCEESLFSIAELRDLKALYLDKNLDNFDEHKNLTLNYLRTIRTMLYRECSNLVLAEWNLSDASLENLKTNILVRNRQQPTKEDLAYFFETLLDIRGLNLKVDIDYEAYAQAFALSTSNIPEAERVTAPSIRRSYTNICIALAMDPLVILY